MPERSRIEELSQKAADNSLTSEEQLEFLKLIGTILPETPIKKQDVDDGEIRLVSRLDGTQTSKFNIEDYFPDIKTDL